MYIFHSCTSLHVVWLCREAKKAVVILESLTQLPPPSPRRTQTPTFNNKGNSSLGFLRPVTQSVWSTITPHLVLEPHGQSKLKAFRFHIYICTLYDKKKKNCLDVPSTDKICIVDLFELTILIKPFPDYDSLVLWQKSVSSRCEKMNIIISMLWIEIDTCI